MKFTAKEWVTLYTVVEQARSQASVELKELESDETKDTDLFGTAEQYELLLRDWWRTLDRIRHKLDSEEV